MEPRRWTGPRAPKRRSVSNAAEVSRIKSRGPRARDRGVARTCSLKATFVGLRCNGRRSWRRPHRRTGGRWSRRTSGTTRALERRVRKCSPLGASGVLGNLNVVSSIDVARFKEVLGHFVPGVAVVTAATPEGPVGFTCQPFGAVSLLLYQV